MCKLMMPKAEKQWGNRSQEPASLVLVLKFGLELKGDYLGRFYGFIHRW